MIHPYALAVPVSIKKFFLSCAGKLSNIANVGFIIIAG